MLNRSLQITQTLDPNAGVARLAASGHACTTGTGMGVEHPVTAIAYVKDNSLVARIAGVWAAIARKSMVPAFHDRWPLCPT